MAPPWTAPHHEPARSQRAVPIVTRQVRAGATVVIGIDIGTYGSKGVACLADGTVLARSRLEHDVSTPNPGEMEHDADAVWWHDLVELCRLLLDGLGDGIEVAAVSITTCGPCLLPVDAGGRPLRPGILYGVDTRATDQIARLAARIDGEVQGGTEGDARRGSDVVMAAPRLSSQDVGPKILWIAEQEPAIYQRTARFHTATSYLVHRLTGHESIDRHQAAYFAPFVSAAGDAWDLQHAVGLDLGRRLPPIRWPKDIAGAVSADAAAATGLPPGTPVLTGTSDGPTEALAVGAMESGTVAITYGTTTTLMTFAELAGPATGLWVSDGFEPGRRCIGAGLSTSGAITGWLRRGFARELAQANGAEMAEANASLSAEAAASPPGANGLLVLPYFSGERTPFIDPWARGTIAGLGLNHTRGDLYRAILEGIAFGVRELVEAFRAQGVPVTKVRASGGGTHDDLAVQIISDVTGLAQEIPEEAIGASYGAAYLGAEAVGLIPAGSRAADAWVRIARRVDPEPATAALYAERYELYRRLYRETRDINNHLARAGVGA